MHEHDSDMSELPFAADELAALTANERALVTPEAIARWTADLAPDDRVTARQIVQLERTRRATLATLRDGIELTDMEFRLWRLLQRHEGRTVQYPEIMRELWPQETRRATPAQLWSREGLYGRYAGSIQQYISKLKRKLEIDPKRPQHFVSEAGIGYRWYSAPPVARRRRGLPGPSRAGAARSARDPRLSRRAAAAERRGRAVRPRSRAPGHAGRRGAGDAAADGLARGAVPGRRRARSIAELYAPAMRAASRGLVTLTEEDHSEQCTA